MRIEGKSTRFNERRKLEMPVHVSYYESRERSWSETSKTEEATICGVGLIVSKPVEPNKLIKLSFPMPKNLRLFDFLKDQYEVWGIVRSVSVLEASLFNNVNLKIGVALIGENPPASFLADPETLYDLSPVLRDGGFWSFRQLPRNWVRSADFFDPPQRITERVSVAFVNEEGKIAGSIEAQATKANEAEIELVARHNGEIPNYLMISANGSNSNFLAKIKSREETDVSGYHTIRAEFLSGEWTV
ncbi:MAG: hypothetical protein KIS76_15190 [Pyrinomonadaceae bacterium]|nr:hypothetical protein [Pyrinomonadaceae bacterium]